MGGGGGWGKNAIFLMQHIQEELHSLVQSQAEKLKSHENENMRLTQDLERLRASQLTEIDLRCREVDTLKQQLSGQLSTLQQDHDNLSRQLVEQRAEKDSLLGRLARLEREKEGLGAELAKRQQECEGRVRIITDHAEQVKMENSALQSQLSQQQRLTL